MLTSNEKFSWLFGWNRKIKPVIIGINKIIFDKKIEDKEVEELFKDEEVD